MSSPKNRITMKLKHPNPLFEKWLTEWRDEAIERDTKMQHCFHKALQSLKKYPLPLEKGRDCKILNGFGDRLCQMLDEKLNEHKLSPDNQDIDLVDLPGPSTESSKRKVNAPINKILVSPKRNKKEYTPANRSGAYAILIALYEYNEASNICMNKIDLIASAQKLCDKSFKKPDPGSYYTAWSSMKTLIDKKLVSKHGNPSKFSLTEEGILLAKRLHENNVIDVVEDKQIEDRVNKQIKQNKGQHIDSYQVVNNKLPKSRSESSQESNSDKENYTRCETVLFEPFSFEVLLIVDKQETAGSKEKLQNDPILSEITNLDVPHDVRHLKVGDYTWICRNKSTNFELVLPYVIERKRMDDFGSSIKDSRYHEQKFRLKQCGIQNIIYLIESYGDNIHIGLPLSTLHQAATNTLVQDGFTVKFSDGTRGTAQYLNCMTKILKENYESKTVMSCPKSNLEKSSITDDLIPLMTFADFNQAGSKYKNFTASEMFIKQLVQLKGLSVDKALAIVEKYPTPKMLKMALEKDIEITEKELANIKFGKGKLRIGPVISNNLCRFYSINQFM